MLQKLELIESEALGLLALVESQKELAQWRRDHLGRESSLASVLGSLGSLPREERPAVGKLANEIKRHLLAALEAREGAFSTKSGAQAVDVTLPGLAARAGRIHPVTSTIRRMKAAFRQMGFQVFEGPDVETDEYNFALLNFPPNHPARDSYDTFYTTRPDVLLRTHTSPGQVRVMQRTGAPVRTVIPGACYRYDQPDASHNLMFYQMEGLAVGASIRMTDLLGAIRGLVEMLFGDGHRVRFRGHYFPFTEPSIEADLACTVCNGEGCRLCKYSGWVEIIPGGMVHPNVLRNGGIDPSRFTGFAFGAGVDRIAALLYRLPDIRDLYANDLRFLKQFG
ncbi:MAG: phenylalanine--tRNA ligase subunit alpha [Anaerolineae bacterium]